MSSAKVKVRETGDSKDKSNDSPVCQKSKQRQRQECPGDTWDKPLGKVDDKEDEITSSQRPDDRSSSTGSAHPLRGDVRMERQLRSGDRQSLRRAAAAGAAAIVHATSTSSPSAAREWPVSSERSECSASVSASPATDSVPSSPQHRSEFQMSRHDTGDAHTVSEVADQDAADQSAPSTPPNAARHMHLKRKRNLSIDGGNFEDDADDEEDELCDSDLRHPNEEDINDVRSIAVMEKDEIIETCPRSPSVQSDASSTSLSSFSPSSSNMITNYRSSSGHANRATGNYSEDGSATTLMGSATSLEDHLPPVSPREGKYHNLKLRDEGQRMADGSEVHEKRQSIANLHREDGGTTRSMSGRHGDERATSVATRSQSAITPVVRQASNGQVHEPIPNKSAGRYTVTMLSGAPQRKSCDRCFRMKTKCSRAGPGASSDGPCEGCVRRGFGHDCVTSRPDFPHPRITLAKRPRRELGATLVSGNGEKTLLHASPSSRARAVQWSRQHSAYAASNHDGAVRRHDDSCLSSTTPAAVSPSLMISSKSTGSNRQALAYENGRDARTTYLDTYGRHEHLNAENQAQSPHDSQLHLRYSSTRNRRSPSVDAIDRPRREMMTPSRLNIATHPRSMHSHSSASYHPCDQAYGGARSASTAIEEQQQKYNGVRSSIYGNASKSGHSYQGCEQGDEDLCRNVSVLHRSLHESSGDGDGPRPALSGHLRSMHTTDLRELSICITHELVRRTTMPSPPPPIRTSPSSTMRYSERA